MYRRLVSVFHTDYIILRTTAKSCDERPAVLFAKQKFRAGLRVDLSLLLRLRIIGVAKPVKSPCKPKMLLIQENLPPPEAHPVPSTIILLASGAWRTKWTVRPCPCPLRRPVPPREASRSSAVRIFCRLAKVSSRLAFFSSMVPQLSKNCETPRKESTPASCIGPSRLFWTCGLSKASKYGWKKAPW
eukprot:COSAG02_NODE_169_length_31557_cov_25.092473_10_plen_187_part_00